MSDLLVQRLKAAKRELTALKTAHKRGLGLLRIYRTQYLFSDIPGISDQEIYSSVKTTITFSTTFEPYPFAYLVGMLRESSQSVLLSVETRQVEYSNNGYTITFTGSIAIYYSDLGLDRMFLYSTSPPTSISCDWSI